MTTKSKIEQTLIAELESESASAYKKVFEKESVSKEPRQEKKDTAPPRQPSLALKQSEERFRRLFETAQDGILLLDAESGVITEANPFIRNLLGYPEDELIGKRLWEIGAFIDIKDSKLAFEELLRNEYIRYEDLPLRTKTGAVREVEFVSNVYRVKRKKVIQCNIRDVTERKMAEKLIRESEERYRRLFEAAQDGILILDGVTGTITDANPFIIDSLGYSLQELRGKMLWEIGAFADVKESKAAFEELQQKEYIRYDDLPLKTKAGIHRHVEFVSNVYLVSGKKVIQCNIRDITDRRDSLVALIHERNMIQSMMDNTPDQIYFKDRDSRFLRMSASVAEKFGVTDPLQLVGKKDSDYFSDEHSRSAFNDEQKIIETGTPLINMEERETWPDGRVSWASTTKLPFRDASGQIIGTFGISRDVTGRKQAEQVLKESEKRFKTLFDQAPLAIALLDLEGRPIHANETLSTMVGYTKEELSRMKFTDFTYPDDIDKDLGQFVDLIEGKISKYEMEKRFIHKNGNIVWVNLSVTILRDEQGGQLEVLGIAEDITKRKRTEMALRESNEKFHQLANNITDAFWIRSPDMKEVHYISPAFEQIWGRTVESLYANPQEWPEFIHPADRERVRQAFESLTGENVSLDVEYRIVRPDGEIRLVHVRGFQVRNDHNMLIRHIGIVADITERKHAEDLQRETERRFKEMLENIDLLALLLDREGRVTFCNEYLLRLTGYTRERVIGQNWFAMFIPPELNIEQVFIESMANGSLPQHNENELITAAGERRIISWNNIELRDIDGHLIGSSSIGEDITERKHAEQLLRASEEKFRNLIETLPDGFYRSTAAGRFLDVNPMLVKMLGYGTKDELMQIDIPSELYFTREDRSTHSGDQKDGLVTETNLLRKKDGGSIWVEDRCRYLTDTSGNIQFHEGIMRDISDRRLADEKLKKSEEKYRGIFENIQDVFFETRLDGTIEELSPSIAAASKGQYHREDLLGHSMFDYYCDATERKTLIEELQKKGTVSDFEVTMKNRDGSKIQCSVSSTLQYDAQGRPERIIGSLRDITERIIAQEAMRTSEERFRLLFDNSIDGILVTRPDGSIDSANSAACRIFGATEEEIIALGRNGVVNTEDPRLSAALRERDFTGTFSGELSLKRKDGSIFPGEISTSLYNDTKGNLISSMSIRDISERKEAEKQIALLAHTLKSIIECVSVTDMNNTILFVNAAFLETYGFAEEEIVGNDISLIRSVHQPSESVGGILSATLAGGWSGELLNRKKNGEEFPVSLSTSCVRDENGNAVALVGVATDITERRHDEIHLQKSEERYRRLVEFSPSAIIVHNHVTIIYVNPAAIKLLAARDASELIGKPIRDFLHNDHKESARLRPPTSGSNPALPLSKEKFLRLDGVTIDVEVVSLLIDYDGISAMQDVVRDVTDQNKIQQELFQSQKSQSIGTLAGGIAHDFNNILGIILGYTHIIGKAGPNGKNMTESLAAINQAVNRGAALVRQILTFARKTETSFEPVSITDLVHELVSMLSQTFPKVITFTVQIPADIPFIFADRTQMHQVLLNLCVNARDAMPKGGGISITAGMLPGDSVKELFPAADQQWYICLTVSDTGEGMNETTRERIFDPFFTTKPQGKGTGLGLSVVYGVVQAHHGFISVTSVPNKGTTFQIYLPSPETTQKNIEPRNDIAVSDGGTETILLVEDEVLLLDMTRFLLESCGYTVLVAHDGAEAVDVFTNHHAEISLVITDLGLPVMTGLEEYLKLREVDSNVTVIFASGFFDTDVRSELIANGAKYFLQKPYVATEMLKMIRDALQ
jgi:PAS domain S-box-containing protein